MVAYPARALTPWDVELKTYIDSLERLTSALGVLGLPASGDALAALLDQFRPTSAAGLVQTPDLFDDFIREDVANLDGLLSSFGRYTYLTGNAGTTSMPVVNNRLVPTGVTETGSTNGVDILYALRDVPLKSVAVEFVWTGGDIATTGGENMVLGACKRTFGRGSIQPCIYAVERPSNPGIRWQLFSPPNPQTAFPYPTIAEGGLDMGPFDRTGNTKYRFAMHRTGLNQITLDLPDGSRPVIDDPLTDPVSGLSLVDTYWGSIAGWQLRRNALTDGFLEIVSIATESMPEAA